jgi:hypothetical protein
MSSPIVSFEPFEPEEPPTNPSNAKVALVTQLIDRIPTVEILAVVEHITNLLRMTPQDRALVFALSRRMVSVAMKAIGR